MEEKTINEYLEGIEVLSKYSDEQVEEKMQELYGLLHECLTLYDRQCSSSPIKSSSYELSKKYGLFLETALDILSVILSLLNETKYNKNKYRLLYNFTKGDLVLFIKKFKKFKDYTAFEDEFRIGLIFEVFNAVEYLATVGMLVANSNTPYIFLYKKGCDKLRIGYKLFFSFLRNSLSIVRTSIDGGYWASIGKDFQYLANIANFRPINTKRLLPSDREFVLKMAFLANGGYIEKTQDVKDHLSSQKVTDMSPYKLNRINNIDGSFDFHSVYGHLSEDKAGSVYVSFGGTYVKGLSMKTFATIITDLAQVKNVSCAYIVSVGLVQEVVDSIHNQNKQVYVCGHSLGGGYTQFSSAAIPNVKGYTFNPAGLSTKSMRLLNKQTCSNLTHIRVSTDLVSCIGILIEGDIYDLPSRNKCWEVLDNHKIETIIDLLKP